MMKTAVKELSMLKLQKQLNHLACCMVSMANAFANLNFFFVVPSSVSYRDSTVSHFLFAKAEPKEPKKICVHVASLESFHNKLLCH